MSIQVLDPKPLVLFDMVELGTTEVVSNPIALWQANEFKAHADYLELQVSLFGNLAATALDVLINKYRCPNALAEYKDTAAYATENIDASAGADLGTERVINGNFTSGTGWSVPGWTIGSGVATHTGPRSRLARVVAATAAGGHLMRVTATDLGTGAFRLRAGITGAKLPNEWVEFLDEAALPTGEAVPHTFARYIPSIPPLTFNEDVQIFVEADNEDFAVDDVSLALCTPYRHTAMFDWSDVGAGLVLGFLPAGDMAGIFMRAVIRRYRILT